MEAAQVRNCSCCFALVKANVNAVLCATLVILNHSVPPHWQLTGISSKKWSESDFDIPLIVFWLPTFNSWVRIDKFLKIPAFLARRRKATFIIIFRCYTNTISSCLGEISLNRSTIDTIKPDR